MKGGHGSIPSNSGSESHDLSRGLIAAQQSTDEAGEEAPLGGAGAAPRAAAGDLVGGTFRTSPFTPSSVLLHSLIPIALAFVKIGIGAAALFNQSCLGQPLIPIWLVGE